MKAELAQTPDDSRRLDLLINLSNVVASTEPAEAAKFADEAVRLAKARGDRSAQGQALLNAAGANFMLGDYDAAQANAERARTLARQLGDRDTEAAAVLNLGTMLMARAAWTEAIARFQESLALLDAKAHPDIAAKAFANISGCWLYRGDLKQAEENQRHALALRRQADDRAGEAESLMNLGVITYSEGDFAGAIQFYTEALSLSESLGEKRNVAAAASGLATVLVDQRRLDDAVRYLDQAIAISRETSDRSRLGFCLASLSIVRQKQERYPEAMQAAEEAARLGAELQDPRLEGFARATLGDALMDQGRTAEAVEALRAAMQPLEKAGDRNLLEMARVRLAKALRLDGKLDQALKETGEVVALAEKSGNKRTLVAALDEQANIREALGDAAGALRDARHARKLDRELLDETTAKKIADAQTRYETEKKERQIEALEKGRQLEETKKRLTAERNARQIEVLEKDRRLQRQARNSAIAGAILLLALAVAALMAYRVKRQSGIVLADKNERLGEANRLITIERAKSDSLLLSILPASIATRLKENAGTIADSHPQATVLFGDLVGFTVYSQTVSPEELVRMLDQIFTRFDNLALRHGVEKIKTIGDCYMVVAGLPEPSPVHCEAIARMALEMRDELQRFNAEEGLGIQIRIGFHTGPVVAGVIGRQKFNYDLWGDTVNTASRMESSGAPGRVHISETVARQLGADFKCEPRGEIEVKGKGRLTTFFLERADVITGSRDASAAPLSALA